LALLSLPTIPQSAFDFGRTLIAVAALISLLYFGRDFFVTLIISAVFAFILDPAVLLVMATVCGILYTTFRHNHWL